MRNTTKLKAILLKYIIRMEMNDDGIFTLELTDKLTGKNDEIRAKNYSEAIRKSYSHLLQELKKEEKMQ